MQSGNVTSDRVALCHFHHRKLRAQCLFHIMCASINWLHEEALASFSPCEELQRISCVLTNMVHACSCGALATLQSASMGGGWCAYTKASS